MKINEGMRPLDLRGMVKGEVVVDQYESKIDDTAIVIAFQVNDISAANDLNRFIQKSYVELLDTEVSAAPAQDGYYLVFVEMPPGDNLAEDIGNICGDVSALCGIENWVVSPRGEDSTTPLDQNSIISYLKKYFAQDIAEFFQNSNVDSITLEEGIYTLDQQVTFKVADFDEIKQVLTRNNLFTQAIDESITSRIEMNFMRKFLGEGWEVNRMGEFFLVYQEEGEKTLLISDLKLPR